MINTNYEQIINNNKNIFLFISSLFKLKKTFIFNLEDIIQIKYFIDKFKINNVDKLTLFKLIDSLYMFDECGNKYLQLIINNKLNTLYNQIESKL